MKKLMIIGIVITIIGLFTFPAALAADEGDAEDFVGVRDSENHGGVVTGQYLMGDTQDTTGDGEGDGDTEIFCVDGDKYVNQSANAYTLTDIDVSSELEGEVTGSDTITEVEALAVEILSKEATGASSVEDQVAVWQETGDRNASTYNSLSAGQKENVDAINVSAESMAQGYIDDGGGLTLDEFLDDEDVNEIDITVEQDESIFTGNAGTATATMENPLVPGITDEGKDVFWYILSGAFNISFSPNELVTETDSDSPAANTDPTEMSDVDVDSDDIADPNDAGYVESKEDNKGTATVSYYYFWWGIAEYPENTIGINLFTWVDIDEDGKFDIVDIDGQKAADGQDSDGDVVGDFQNANQVIQVDDKGTVDTSDDTVAVDGSGNIITKGISEEIMDIHKVEGGKMVIADSDLGNQLLREEGRDNNYQRFSTLSYTEPFDDDPEYFGTLIFKMSGDQEPLKGAVFGIYLTPDASGDPIQTVVTGEDGYASTSGLGWGTYYVKEIATVPGYIKDNTVYTVVIGGNGTSVTGSDDSEGIIPFSVINNPEPPDEPDEPDEPDKPGDSLQVLGIQELPFTGMNPVIPISGLTTIFSGISMIVLSLIRRKKK
jgi:hypothetical protein